MTNKRRGGVQVELGGQSYTLRFTFNSIALLEERLNSTLPQILAGQFGVRVVREALSVALSPEDRHLTPNKIGRLMDQEPEKIAYLMNKVFEALSLAMGIGEDVAEEVEDEGEAGEPADEPA